TEAVAGSKRRLRAVSDEAAKRLEARDLVGQQRGLRETSLVQLLAGIAKAELGHVVTDDLAGPGIKVAGDGKRLYEVGPHSSVLRALARKNVENLLVSHS